MSNSKNNSDLFNNINSRLQRIANVLLLNASFIDNPGLLNGKMGIAIFFYHYAHYSGSKIFEDYAGELIDQICDEINTNTIADFANGLTGIGWGIDYLVRNGFVEAETNEILGDIEKTVYHKLLFNYDIADLQGFLLYYLARFKNRYKSQNKKEYLKDPVLISLLHKCEKFPDNGDFLDQIATSGLNTPFTIRHFLSEVRYAGLFPKRLNMPNKKNLELTGFAGLALGLLSERMKD
jgi:hypothetical protein